MNKLLVLVNFIFMYLSKIIPKKYNRWVFGSWLGECVSDNSKWFYEYLMREHKEIDSIYITNNNEQLNEIVSLGGKAYKYGSIKSMYYIATAKVVFLTHSNTDLSKLYLIGGAYKVFFWHASVLIKKLGNDMQNNKELSKINKIKEFILDKLNEYDLYLAPSLEYVYKLISAFKAEENRIKYLGFPRTSILLEGSEFIDNNYFFDLIYDKYKVDIKDKTIITYMPTFRDKTSDIFSFNKLNFNEYQKLNILLNKYNAVIIEKNHFVDSVLNKVRNESMTDRILNINELKNLDPQILLYFTNLLITDYSSSYADFAFLDRPIIHYVYDYEYYKTEDRGLYYEIDEVLAGAIVTKFDDLVIQMEKYLDDSSLDTLLRKEFINKFLTFSDLKSNDSLFEIINKDIR